jgi:ketosteroid isomerase-like protein
MNPSTNTRAVRDLFAAFQRGDVGSVLGLLAEEVEWSSGGPPEIPYAGTYRGRGEVARFLAALDAELDYEQWEPQEFIAQGDTVAVVGEERWRAKRTGKAVDNPWVLVLTLRDGKVARFRNFEDTAAVAAAFGNG